MKHKALAAASASIALLALAGCSAGGDGSGSATGSTTSFPERNITLVIPYDAGGSFDPAGRAYASLLEDELGVSVIPENRPGAAATLGTKFVLDAEPDGYTIGLGSGSAAAFQPLVSDTGYDGVEDMQAIAKLGDSVQAITVRADARWNSIKEFIDEAKANPAVLKIGVAGLLSATDLQVSAIEHTLGVEFVHVPHEGGSGEALTSLLAGRVDAIVTTVNSVAPQFAANEVRPLVVMSRDEVGILPGVPTMISEGYEIPGSPGQLYFIFGPLGIPEDVLKVLEEASLKVVQSDEFKKFLDGAGMQGEPLGIEGTTEDLRANQDAYATLVETLGIGK